MFMMPTPPTTRLTAATAPRSAVKVSVTSLMVSSISVCDCTSKSSSAPLRSRWRRRRFGETHPLEGVHGTLVRVRSCSVQEWQLDVLHSVLEWTGESGQCLA